MKALEYAGIILSLAGIVVLVVVCTARAESIPRVLQARDQNIPGVLQAADPETLIPAIRELSETIAAEAADQGYTGMYLVANTIKNRALKGKIDPLAVVRAPGQYYGHSAWNRAALRLQVRKEADYLAVRIMTLPDKTNGALYFRTEKEKRQKWHKVETVRYKDHIFYK